MITVHQIGDKDVEEKHKGRSKSGYKEPGSPLAGLPSRHVIAEGADHVEHGESCQAQCSIKVGIRQMLERVTVEKINIASRADVTTYIMTM